MTPDRSLRQRLQALFRWPCYQLRLLPHRPRLFWHQLWIRRDEFHPSLNMDGRAMRVMNAADRDRYLTKLGRRRRLAHLLDPL